MRTIEFFFEINLPFFIKNYKNYSFQNVINQMEHDDEDDMAPLTMVQMKRPLLFTFSLLGLATLAFIGEIIVYKWQNWRGRKYIWMDNRFGNDQTFMVNVMIERSKREISNFKKIPFHTNIKPKIIDWLILTSNFNCVFLSFCVFIGRIIYLQPKPKMEKWASPKKKNKKSKNKRRKPRSHLLECQEVDMNDQSQQLKIGKCNERGVNPSMRRRTTV